MASARQAAAPILSLFREVLKLHRERLPPPMRRLGDSYVAAEFRSHLKNPKTTQAQWSQFVSEWRNYLSLLRGEEQALPGNAGVSAELVSGVYDSLSDEQRKRVEALREELSKRGEPQEPMRQ
ncbi:hypothetical protein GPECTOR_132g595 [Gonium pectorale]|uniref:Succinate dehydrogenase assembly factor 3 n=1 Tax=Gonium pectorale TaxID=33097 RepID=A0A150FY83_GONPE|nr:hypothetical protein GPECTOR_132g595 [Gonium pectorale]|eukprot:KXZ42583.1 hypothetical protein GPECTOR_132g595 [Gonium pectorale]